MEAIIAEINPHLVAQELTAERFLRNTNKAGNEIYVIDAHCAPNAMREIGRLREIAYRSAGGGTGKCCDIDEFDTMARPCQQLVVWNPAKKEIVGGYRFITGDNMTLTAQGIPCIATSHKYYYSEKFLAEYLPYSIELGRAFVRLEYQSTKAGSKALYALDNLWDGLGAIVTLNPQIKYLFGKVTMYSNYPRDCRNLLYQFLHLYFPHKEKLLIPKPELVTSKPNPEIISLFAGNNYKADYQKLNTLVRAHSCSILPMLNAYMSLSPTMQMFGIVANKEFGNVEDIGILMAIDEITPGKKNRHINSFSLHTSC